MVLPFEIAFGIAASVVKHHGVGAVAVAHNRNDDHLLRSCVYHTTITKVSFCIVERNVNIAATLVKVDVNCCFRGSRFNVVGANIVIQFALQLDFFSFAWNVVVFHFHIDIVLLRMVWNGGMGFTDDEAKGTDAGEKRIRFFIVSNV